MDLKAISQFKFLFFITSFIFFHCLKLNYIQAQTSANVDESEIITNIKQHINILGSDSLQGRGTGSLGERLASEYIVQYLQTYGIIPAVNGQSYFQNIPMYGSEPLTSSKMILHTRQADYDLKLFDDYLLYKSGAQTYIPNQVPLVFVGYGIIAPEYDYNDYQSVDVTGKIVVCLNGEPEYEDPNYFKGSHPTIYSSPESKQRLAIGQGAIGSIIIPHPGNCLEEEWQRNKREFSFEDVTLAYRVTGNLSLLLCIDVAESIFDGAAYSFDQVLDMDREHALKSFELNTKISFKGQFSEREFIARNVAGMIRGSDISLSDTYLIISAHYDHLGIGFSVNGDSIYNGVGDNALGVAGVLELARLLNITKNHPRRSILFLFSTGEEKGLLGSRYYIDHPLVPLSKTVANINIDGLAIYDRFKEVVALGSDLSTLGEILEAIARLKGLHLAAVPPQFLNFESFARSDQFAFALGGIPSILISDGLNYETITPAEGLKNWFFWQDQIYHTPFDDLYQPINFRAVQQHVEFLFDFIHRLSRMEQQPQWKNGVEFRNYQLQTIAERR